MRTSKTANGTVHNYIVDGTTIVQEGWGNNRINFLTDESGRYYGFFTSNISSPNSRTYYYYIYNAQGDVISIANSVGAIVAKYIYDAYGNPLKTTDGSGTNVASNATHIANVSPIRYRGYYFDRETGMYYCQSRYYDPLVGRWINADGQINTSQGVLGSNMFTYCNNNPVKYL